MHQNKTPIEITQELIAIHTTRNEVLDKIKEKEIGGDWPGKISALHAQSDQFIKELMAELSNFGDAVQSNVDRTDEYHTASQNMLNQIDSINPSDLSSEWDQLEKILRKIYRDILEIGSELPESLAAIVAAQAGRL